MKRLIAILLVALLAFPALARDWYFAQVSAGANDGTSCANAKSWSFVDTAGNWGVGATKIQAADTLRMCGTITNQVVFRAAAAGITFETGAGITLGGSETRLLYINGRSNVTVDGGSNGYLECTANGSGLTWTNGIVGIDASNTTNCTIKNLLFRNLIVHTSLDDHQVDTPGAVYSSPAAGLLVVTNCVFTNVCWAIEVLTCRTNTTMVFGGNSFYNYDHGVALGMSSNTGPFHVTLITNSFGPTVNWDTTINKYHHDGLHSYNGGTGYVALVVAKNVFYGDWGGNNTGHVYSEQDPTNMVCWDNLHLFNSTNTLANGCWNMPNGSIGINNSYVGDGVTTGQIAIYCGATGRQVYLTNNLFSGLGVNFTVPAPFTSVVVSGRNNLYAGSTAANPWRLNLVNYATFAAWNAVVGEVGSSYTANALLNSVGYPSTVGSPVVDAGYAIGSAYATDISGVVRPQRLAWDIGAYEFPGTVGWILSGGKVYNAVVP